MEIFANILLKKYHRDALFTSFDDIDTDGSGLVHMDEFFSFFRLEPNEFNREIFRIFDTDGNGQLTFQEFVCVVSCAGDETCLKLPNSMCMIR